MEERIIRHSGIYPYEPYGNVRVTVRSQSRNITGRWKYGHLEVSVPPGLSEKALVDVLEEWKEKFSTKLDQAKNENFYHIGQRLDFDFFSVRIESAVTKDYNYISASPALDGDGYIVYLSRDLDVGCPTVARKITLMIERISEISATADLICEAREIARSLGVYPTGWDVCRGHRKLGSCDARGIIKLSCSLTFMPADLRKLIISHELAHLSEMNHSPAFHAILDRYVGGREKELTGRLKDFKWPVFY